MLNVSCIHNEISYFLTNLSELKWTELQISQLASFSWKPYSECGTFKSRALVEWLLPRLIPSFTTETKSIISSPMLHK